MKNKFKIIVLIFILFFIGFIMLYGKERNAIKGKYISILGDSISTFDGISNYQNNNISRYPNENLGITNLSQTWWNIVANHYHANILVNNSSAGGEVFNNTDGAYISRCINLHTNINPDIILVYIGINDVGHNTGISGTFDNISQIYDDANYIYPNTFADSYAIMIDKMINKYKDSDIFVFTIPKSNYIYSNKYQNEDLRNSHNEQIRNIAKIYNLNVIDLDNFSTFNIDTDTNDGLHPNEKGMIKLSSFVINELDSYYN